MGLFRLWATAARSAKKVGPISCQSLAVKPQESGYEWIVAKSMFGSATLASKSLPMTPELNQLRGAARSTFGSARHPSSPARHIREAWSLIIKLMLMKCDSVFRISKLVQLVAALKP